MQATVEETLKVPGELLSLQVARVEFRTIGFDSFHGFTKIDQEHQAPGRCFLTTESEERMFIALKLGSDFVLIRHSCILAVLLDSMSTGWVCQK